MYCTCGDRNHYMPHEGSQNINQNRARRTSVPNTQTAIKSALKTPSRSTTTTPTKKPPTKTPHFSTLPRSRSSSKQRPHLATIFRDDPPTRHHQRRQSEVIPWHPQCTCSQQHLCTCRNNCHYCNHSFSYPHHNYPFNTSSNALGYYYPYPLNPNYYQQQYQPHFQHHHSMINLNQHGESRIPNGTVPTGQGQGDSNSNSPPISNSPPPIPPSVPGCNSSCIFSNLNTPTLPRHGHSHYGSAPHLQPNINYGMPAQEAYRGKWNNILIVAKFIKLQNV